jgi:hypothetical protein
MVLRRTTHGPSPELADLPPVIWIGGGSGAGKSTVSRSLAYRHDLAWYRIDASAYAHRDRLIARGALRADAAAESHDQRWLTPSVEELVDRFVEVSVRGFPLIMEDLRAMPNDVAVIVEGPQLLPALVSPYLPDPRWGVWMLPTPEFRRAALASRWNASRTTSDAERAQEKLLARNDLLDARIRSEATAHGLRVVDVDGGRDLTTMIDHVADLLAHPLANAPRVRTGRARGALRRSENDTMITNVKAWLADAGPAGPPEPPHVPFACECERLGCAAEVHRTVADHETLRAAGHRITAHDHAGSSGR